MTRQSAQYFEPQSMLARPLTASGNLDPTLHHPSAASAIIDKWPSYHLPITEPMLIPGEILPSVCEDSNASETRSAGRGSLFEPRISFEATFNQNTTICFSRPYNALVFSAVQTGDLDQVKQLLCGREASIHDVNPYNLGLPYVGASTCLNGKLLVPY